MSTTKVQSDMVDIDGATTATIATGDKINFLDITDSLVKEDTVQGILDLGGGAWNIIGTVVASNDATITITGLDSTYDTYAIVLSELLPATDDVDLYLRVGDSSGVDIASSDYVYATSQIRDTNTTTYVQNSTGAAQIVCNHVAIDGLGNAAGEGSGGVLYLNRPGDGAAKPFISGQLVHWNIDTELYGTSIFGGRESVITLDRIQFLYSSGNVNTGRMTVWGIAHV